MKKLFYKAAIRKELKKLNRKIDLNILWGLNYKEEAKRHKALLSKLRDSKRGFFNRALSFMTLF
jgi:hypothetical protein